MENFKGVVVAESLDDPTIINRFAVERIAHGRSHDIPEYQLDFKDI